MQIMHAKFHDHTSRGFGQIILILQICFHLCISLFSDFSQINFQKENKIGGKFKFRQKIPKIFLGAQYSVTKSGSSGVKLRNKLQIGLWNCTTFKIRDKNLLHSFVKLFICRRHQKKQFLVCRAVWSRIPRLDELFHLFAFCCVIS